MNGGAPSWVIRENASRPVLLGLYLREAIGADAPGDLPRLRDVERGTPDVDRGRLERQWKQWWAMTVEPERHPSPVPLKLLASFGTAVALPETGAEAFALAIDPHASAALAWVETAHDDYRTASRTRRRDAYRAYAGTIAEHEREIGRRVHSFELDVEVLPLADDGVWWIGETTVAVTDTVRADPHAFDAAIHPIIAQLA